MKYRMVKLEDIADFNAKSYNSKYNWDFFNYLDTGNITENKIKEIQYFDESNIDKLPSRAKRIPEKNSIVYSSVEPNNKHYGFLKEFPNNFVVSTGFVVINVNEELADPKYIYYYLIQNKVIKYLQNLAQESVTTFPAIKASDMGKMKIALPKNMQIQQKISYFLSKLDNKIEVNDRVIANLEEISQTIFKSWFVDFEPFKEGKFVESELGLIPEGWEVVKLKNELDFIRGVEPGSKNYENTKKENYISFYRVGDMLATAKTYIDKKLAKGKVVLEEDVLVSFDGTVGRVAIGLNGSYSSGIRNIKAKPNKYYPKSFLYALFNSQNIQNIIKQHATGTTILHAGKSIDYMKMPYSIKVAKKITEILDPMYNKILNLKNENKVLVKVRDTLLPKLMSGEIDVEKIEI